MSSRTHFLLWAVVIAALIFACDLLIELGVAIAVSYVLVVALSAATYRPRAVLTTGILCSVLTVVGFLLSPSSQSPVSRGLINRCLALFTIWTTAVLCIRVLHLLAEKDQKTQIVRNATAEMELQREQALRRTRAITSIMDDLRLEREKLSASEQRFRLAIESAPTAMLMIDSHGTIVLVNSAAEHLFGYEDESLCDQPVDLLVPLPLRDGHRQARTDFMQSPSPRRMGAGRELFAVRKDGTQFPVEVGLSPVATSEGTCVLATIADLTERKRFEDIQRQLLEFAYVSAGDNAHPARQSPVVQDPDGTLPEISSFDDVLNAFAQQARTLIGAHQCAISYVPDGDPAQGKHAASLSDKYQRYRSYDAIPNGKGIWGLVFKEKRSFCMTDKELKSHPAWNNFGDVRDDCGLEHPPMRGWLCTPVLGTGDGFIGVLQLSDKYEGDFDDEDLRRLERFGQLMAPALSLQYANERLQQHNQELSKAKLALEQSNMDLMQFAYVASHDLQTPLRAIAGFAQFLKRDYHGKFDDKADHYLSRIFEGAKRLQRMINDLLVFSRVDSRARPFEPVDLNELHDEVLDVLRSSIRESEGEVTRGDLPVVIGDRAQLLQLFQNLVANAIKYHGDKPPRVHISASSSDNEFTIEVQDNGIGIDEKHCERIFDVFYRLHSEDEYPGSGIGLAVCRRIIIRHGGQIWVQSTDEGSTFFFTIPKRESNEKNVVVHLGNS